MELNLLVEAPEGTDLACLDVEGKRWCLKNALNTSEPGSLPEYTCISYTWGAGRVPNPFDDSRPMSAQTLPVLIAAMRSTRAKALWIDALCVPARDPQRRATLESMGFIYSRAIQTVIVLSASSFGAVKHMIRSDRLDEDGLSTLNQDVWVKSVWTYQEVVNSQLLTLVSGEAHNGIVDGVELLNRVGYSLSLYKKKYNLDHFDIWERFPALDSLEDVLADWRVSHYQERSALEVLSNVSRRSSSDSFSYFYAMMGAITQQASFSTENPTIANVADKFMRLCEEKNDFSFIFSSADRDERTGMRWRPAAATILPSVLPRHSCGAAQRAHRDSNGLWLEDIVILKVSPDLNEQAQELLRERFQLPESLTGAALVDRTFKALSRMNFTGTDSCLTTEDGLFFPQWTVSEYVEITMLVSAGIRWRVGAPGILQVPSKDRFSYIPGVFAGVISNEKACSFLLQ